jgi:subtilase family serine protease
VDVNPDNPPTVDPDSDVEIDLDVEWAHVVAPDAKIILIEVNGVTSAGGGFNANTSDFINGVETAGSLLTNSPAGGGVVSMSFGFPIEQGTVATDSQIDYTVDQAFAAFPDVSYFAGSGDSGPGQVSYPADSPYVTSVGGTFLTLDSNGARSATVPEEAWNGSGGGVSVVEPEPGFQQNAIGTTPDIPNTNTPGRISPDVAFLSETPAGGVAVYDGSPDTAGNTGFQAVGGTSLATPMFAALVALLNQTRVQSGNTVIGVNLNDAVYVLNNDFPGRDFTPIAAGEGFTPVVPNAAVPNFNESTGWGIPIPTSFIADAASLNVSLGAPTPQTLLVDVPDVKTAFNAYQTETDTEGRTTTTETSYGQFSAPSPGGTGSPPSAAGTPPASTAISIGPSTFQLTLNGVDETPGISNPGTLSIFFDIDLNLANDTFGEVITISQTTSSLLPIGSQFFVEGSVSPSGTDINGDFYSVVTNPDGSVSKAGISQGTAAQAVIQGSFDT